MQGIGSSANLRSFPAAIFAYLTYEELYNGLLEKVEFRYHDFKRDGTDLVPYLVKAKVAFFGGDEAEIIQELEEL